MTLGSLFSTTGQILYGLCNTSHEVVCVLRSPWQSTLGPAAWGDLISVKQLHPIDEQGIGLETHGLSKRARKLKSTLLQAWCISNI